MQFVSRATRLHVHHSASFTVLFFLLLSGLTLSGQTQPSEKPKLNQPAQDQPETTIKKDVNVVNVLATVRNKQGQIVNTLSKDDFKLDDDGRPQTIRYFAKVTDLPLTLGLLVDTSLSQRKVLEQERTASYKFLEDLLREWKDKAFVVHFDSEIELLQDLTSSRPKLEAALQKLEVPDARQTQTSGSPDPGQPHFGGGGTKLYDAVFLASDEVMNKPQGRKALIILSDGVDQGSKVSLNRAIEAAQRSDTLVYTILFADPQAYNNLARHAGYPGGGYPGGRLSGASWWRAIPVADTPGEAIPAAVVVAVTVAVVTAAAGDRSKVWPRRRASPEVRAATGATNRWTLLRGVKTSTPSSRFTPVSAKNCATNTVSDSRLTWPTPQPVITGSSLHHDPERRDDRAGPRWLLLGRFTKGTLDFEIAAGFFAKTNGNLCGGKGQDRASCRHFCWGG